MENLSKDFRIAESKLKKEIKLAFKAFIIMVVLFFIGMELINFRFHGCLSTYLPEEFNWAMHYHSEESGWDYLILDSGGVYVRKPDGSPLDVWKYISKDDERTRILRWSKAHFILETKIKDLDNNSKIQ